MEETPKVHSKSKHKRTSSRNREHRKKDSSRKIEDGVTDINGEASNNNNVVPNENPSITIEDETKSDTKIHRGIIGYMDRTFKSSSTTGNGNGNTLEPPRSPAQRSNRSRASSDKSPKHKRSKSESRRRRERKAGELEVRQANETLMRYLKQCSDLNDASGSLSGDLEINENLDDRKVHRKTKSQRERKSFRLIGKAQPSDLTTILNELNDDIIQNSDIYNPFTPVVSPTTEQNPHVDKIFVQTSSGYRAVDNNSSFYKTSAAAGDTDSNNFSINNAVQLSCLVQKMWINISTICHGLLGGLALAHLILILTTTPQDWTGSEKSFEHYEMHTKIYTNVFFFLAVICFVSILDRIDICQFSMTSLLNTSENKERSISFRSIILIMIYAGTIILNLLAASIDDRFPAKKYQSQDNSTTITLMESLEKENTNIYFLYPQAANEETVYLWNTLSIARSCGAIVGYLMISSMNTNLLYNTLVEMDKYHNIIP
ncbi:uncharacterized protein [Chironomus tepperi]|uniref:uncharacterized protein isoform X1 n=1 Tax=Chironomus tepperi TaxID=113505 RepID=UPI00391F210A